eukprot:51477-Eustigmatos_ZCMA.PRE.1
MSLRIVQGAEAEGAKDGDKRQRHTHTASGTHAAVAAPRHTGARGRTRIYTHAPCVCRHI